MSKPVCVIVTAWNQAQKTMACLESVVAQDYDNVSTLLVDNGSEDDTIEQVSAAFPQVEILSLPRNLCPTGGYNAGFRHALSKGFSLIFLLNNDTRLAPDCVHELVAEAETAPEIGLVMPKIYYADDPKRIWSIGGWDNPWNLEVLRPANDQIDEGQWEEPLDIDDAPFCAVLLKRELLDTIGLPNEVFFLYYEDRDFCRRARLAGFRLRLAPAAHMWHVVSASSGGSDSPAERYWMARSGVLFFRKNMDMRSRWFIVIPWRAASAFRTTWRLLRKGRFSSIKAYWLGLWHGIRGQM
jgi:hypothetical protein